MDGINETQEIISHVNFAANALLAIKQIIAESDNPAVYAELAKELRIAGGAISRIDEMLYWGCS